MERLERNRTIAVVGGATIGLAGVNTMPLLIGALMDGRGLDAAGAGTLGSAELVARAVTALLVAGPVAGGSRRGIALVGALVALVGHAASAGAEAHGALLVARIVAGMGEGLVIAAVNAAAAGSPTPERFFAVVSLVAGGAAALLMAIMPWFSGAFGPSGAFLLLAGLSVLFGPMLLWLPGPPSVDGQRAAAPTPLTLVPLLGIGALGVLELGEGGVWAFTERLGLAAGLGTAEVGVVLAVSALLGLTGAGLAAALGTRFGRLAPVALGLAVYAVSVAVLVHVPSSAAFVGANVALGVAFFFTLPYLMGTLAALDPTGRVTAAGAAVGALGAALGPASAGLLVQLGMGWLTAFAVATILVSIVALAPALRSVDRGTTQLVAPRPPPDGV